MNIVIIGKGPSIKRCKRNWIDKYDKVAICGRPIFDGYEHLIGNRADYDFSNCCDLRYYGKKRMKKLGIKKVINTNRPISRNNIRGDKLPNDIEYDPNGRKKVEDIFKKYDLDPATGTIALENIIAEKKYKKIGLIGFDLMKVGEDVYYFPKKKVQKSLQRLYDNKIYSNDGKRIMKTGHNLDKTFKYICRIIKNNPQIQFEILSNRKFPKFKNLTLLP